MNTRLQSHNTLVSILFALGPCVIVLTTCEPRLLYEKFIAASVIEAIRRHAKKFTSTYLER